MKKKLLVIPGAALVIMAICYVVVGAQKNSIIIQSSIGAYNSLRNIALAGMIMFAACGVAFAIVFAARHQAAKRAELAKRDFIKQQKDKMDKAVGGPKGEVVAALDLIDGSLKVFTEALERPDNSEKFHGAIQELIDILRGTAEYLTDNPDQLKNLRRFLNYYLPATVTYLKTHIDLVSRRKSAESKNIESTLLEIENIVCEMTHLYKEAYDDLFSDKAMDILAEIAVTKSLMKSDMVDIDG